tara:strand:+ start:909 stop:2072 length:1164 start_codon:yes stop_codon:yes gene_type:complete
MANIPIWPGSSSFHPGDTPFGFYDYNPDFQKDADKVAKFCGLRLGYPIENIELQDINFYTAFEEAVTVYSNELFAYKQREDYLSLEGTPYTFEESNVNFQDATITPNLQRIVDLSEQYGTWAGVGGNVDWKKGSIYLTSSVQDYDLDEWATSQGLTGSDIEVMRIFYEPMPASIQMYGGLGFAGSGLGAFANAGMAGYGANSFLMLPLSYDLQMMQGIEMFRDVLFSQFTFQLINNKLRIFPIPTDVDQGGQLWFEYMLKSEEDCATVDINPNTISNISQVPYRNIDYDSVNSVGRSWIFEYTLALSKEILGYVRGKYSTVPIPGAEVTLNQGDLLTSSTADKNALIDRLRAYFDDTSRQKLLERRQAESIARNSELEQVPMTIFIG